jgi:hypothetical protein
VVTKENRKQESFNFTLVVTLAVVVLLAAGGFWYVFLHSPSRQDQQITLTPEAREYVRSLKLSEVEMKASENYMKSTLVEITGKITNNGNRALQLVEINCIFYDPYGQLVLRERVAIVRRSAGGLKPGETRSFRLAFDAVPSSWNQILPQLVIARIDFAD